MSSSSSSRRSFRHFVEQELGKFPHFIIYALLEWILIFILFIDGFLAFFANEFAKFFDMKLPCLLCTRIDHIFVRRNSDFYYNDTMCESHKRYVSYLAYCHVHEKISDIRKMCETCLLSFATDKESESTSSCSSYKPLADNFVVEQDHDRKVGKKVGGGPTVNRCSCCGILLKAKGLYSKESSVVVNNGGSLSRRNLLLLSSSQTPAPSPRAAFVSLIKNEESRGLEIPNIRYNEPKFVADNDQEVILPEFDETSTGIISDNLGKEDIKPVSTPLAEVEELIDDALKTPNFSRTNRFFGIPLTDSALVSATSSPRWTSRILKKSPLEKTDFTSESIEENTTSNEADSGESILLRLKRQVRLDRKSLMALYLELDEERSAAAIAANNAMAMITRLQAEKAAVQMDALQYQRMMEEQAEYDQEALQVMQGYLNKKEREIVAVESELETYREKFGTISKNGSVEDYIDDQFEDDRDYPEMNSQSQSQIQSQAQSQAQSQTHSPRSEQSGSVVTYSEDGFSWEKHRGKIESYDESVLDVLGDEIDHRDGDREQNLYLPLPRFMSSDTGQISQQGFEENSDAASTLTIEKSSLMNNDARFS